MLENFWNLFAHTGNTGVYLMYKQYLKDDDKEEI